MKIIVLGGAGHMAQPSINYLVNETYVKEIVLVDLDKEKTKEIATSLGEKVSIESIDIMNKSALKKLLKGSDLVMNFIGPYFKFGTQTLEASIDVGVNYIDICDDYDVTIRSLELDAKAKEKNVLAITGMGASPGITNLLAKLGSDALDTTEEINTHWVVGESGPSGFGVLMHMFHIISGNVPTFLEGEVQEIEAFSQETSKKIKFNDPIGEVTVYHVGHPEPVTLPQFIPGVKKVTNYGALLPEEQNQLFKLFVDIGLTSSEPIDFKGEKIKPLDFLLYFLQDKQLKEPDRNNDTEGAVSATEIEVIGTLDGEETSYTFSKSGYGGMAKGTSIPTAVAASLMLQGKVENKGVMPPEGLNVIEMVEALTEIGFFSKDDDGFRVRKRKGNLDVEGSIADVEKFTELYNTK